MPQQNQQQPINKNLSQQQNHQTDSSLDENKMAQNPNPRANENIKHTPFDKEQDEGTVGTEITDGEAG
jgi:hypothetical protein